MAFSPDGKTIATGGADKLVHMWNTESGQKTILQTHTHEVTTLAFSPDGKTLASGEGPPREWTVHLWDTETGQYKSTLEGYRYGISSYGFSPDGKLLVTAGNQDETILLWNPESGTPEHRFRGHEKGVASFLFSPDGTKIATASHVHVVRLWDVYSGELVYTLEGQKNGSTLAFSPDGEILSIGSGDGKILSWITETGQLKYTLKYPESGTGPVTSIAYSPDGQTLVTATHGPEGETPRVWHTRTGKFQGALTGHTKRVTSAAFLPDGTLLSTGRDGTIRLWDTETGTLKNTIDHGPTGAVFSPHGEFVASKRSAISWVGGEWENVWIWNAQNGQHKHTLRGSFGAFSPDGETIATADRGSTVRLWNLASGQLKHTLQGYDPSLVAFSPDEKTLVIQSGNWSRKSIRLWDTRTGELIIVLNEEELKFLSFSPDGKTMAVRGPPPFRTDEGQAVNMWDTETGLLRSTIEGNERSITSAVFSPDGKILAITSDDVDKGYDWYTVSLWDIGIGQLIGRIGERGIINRGQPDAAFSGNGKTLIITGREPMHFVDSSTGQLVNTVEVNGCTRLSPDGKHLLQCRWGGIELWDLETRQLINTLETPEGAILSLVFSPGGDQLACSTDHHVVRLWDAATGQETASLRTRKPVTVLAFSPDGKTLATGAGWTPELWDITTGQRLAFFEGHGADVESLAFSPDGKSLLSEASNHSILLWDLSPYRPERTAVEPSTTQPSQTALLANYPNPFNPETWIPYQLNAPAKVRLAIFDIRGARVREIDLGYQQAGQYLANSRAAHWDGRDEQGEPVATGVYLYRLKADSFLQVRKMLLLR